MVRVVHGVLPLQAASASAKVFDLVVTCLTSFYEYLALRYYNSKLHLTPPLLCVCLVILRNRANLNTNLFSSFLVNSPSMTTIFQVAIALDCFALRQPQCPLEVFLSFLADVLLKSCPGPRDHCERS